MKLSKCVLIFLLMLAACREPIVHNIEENDANRILSSLIEINIKAEKIHQADGLWSVAVDESEAIQALKHLAQGRILRSERPKAVRESSLVSSREDQRFYYERSLSHEIEYTLLSIDGVLDARIHLNLPARDPLFGQKVDNAEDGSASVLIVVDANTKLDRAGLANLVAGASGIKAEKVSILMNSSGSIVPKENKIAPKIVVPAEVLPATEQVLSSDYHGFGLLLTWPGQIAISLIIMGIAGFFYASRKSSGSGTTLADIKNLATEAQPARAEVI